MPGRSEHAAERGLAEKLAADPDIRREFTAVYGKGPDAGNLVDVMASFERSLVNTGQQIRPLAGSRRCRAVGRGTGWISVV